MRLLSFEPVITNKIRQIVRFFETSKITGADYSAIALLPDGPNKRVQVTYGASQTTEYGNLKNLLIRYVDSKGKYAEAIKPFLSNMGDPRYPSLASVPSFIRLLRDAGTDPVMQIVQDIFFNEFYFQPAFKWAQSRGFMFPLSYLVIYDSFVHSGGILTFLQNRFKEKVPSSGGREKVWIEDYVKVRDAWLEGHMNKILRKTDYRTDSFYNAIQKSNWRLNMPFEVVNYSAPSFSGTLKVNAIIS
jgi:chitosanase